MEVRLHNSVREPLALNRERIQGVRKTLEHLDLIKWIDIILLYFWQTYFNILWMVKWGKRGNIMFLISTSCGI